MEYVELINAEVASTFYLSGFGDLKADFQIKDVVCMITSLF